MITIKNEDAYKYWIKLKQRVNIEYDGFDEDEDSYDGEQAFANFSEQATKVANSEEFIKEFFQEKAGNIIGSDVDVDESFASAVIYLKKPMSKSDIEFYFDEFLNEVLSDVGTEYVQVSGDVDYDDFDPTTSYGHVSRSENREWTGEISIAGTTGKVEIEISK